MSKEFTYSKQEKLKSRKLLEAIFKKGQSFTVYPIKLFYLQPEEPVDFYIKAGVGVSSRHFKHAVDRNRIKRMLREAYRTQKQPLHTVLAENGKQMAAFFLYIDKVLPEYAVLELKMQQVLAKLEKHIQHENLASNT